jgi:hypothetical protein
MRVGQRIGGLTFLGFAALLLAAGCSSQVSAGEEGDTINLSRCWGVDCGSKAQSITGTDSAAEACTVSGRKLLDRVDFEPFDAAYGANELRRGPDGSFWILATKQSQSPHISDPEPVLIRYSSEGELVGVVDPIASAEQYTGMTYTLGVDGDGNAVVALYTAYAPDADTDVIERMFLYSYDARLQQVGERIAFSGASPGLLVTDSTGALAFAGNAMHNAERGVLTRLIDREPTFVQTNVPSGGISTTGVCGLHVTEDGSFAVLSQRVPRSDNGNGPTQFGIATFDHDGNPLADLVVPGQFEPGYGAAMAGTADGFVLANANIVEHSQNAFVPTALVRGFSEQGKVDWAFEVRSGWPNALADAETGRAFVDTYDGLAVIEPGGASCEALGIPAEAGALQGGVGAFLAQGQYIYSVGTGRLSRFTLPTE